MSDFKLIAEAVAPSIEKASFDSVIDEIRSDVKLMKELSDLGVKEFELSRYVPLLTTILDERRFCAKCPGLKKCPQSSVGMIHTPFISSSGLLAGSLGPCDLSQRSLVADSHYIYRDFPSEWSDFLFTDPEFKDLRYRSFKKAFKEMLKKGTLTPWIYLYVPSDAEKGHAAAAVSNGLAQKGNSVAYLDVAKRFRKPASYKDEAASSFLNKLPLIKEADFVVLDGLGSGDRSAYSRDELLLPLLSARANGKMTLLVSDFHIQDLIYLYSPFKNEAPIAQKIQHLILRNAGKETALELSL